MRLQVTSPQRLPKTHLGVAAGTQVANQQPTRQEPDATPRLPPKARVAKRVLELVTKPQQESRVLAKLARFGEPMVRAVLAQLVSDRRLERIVEAKGGRVVRFYRPRLRRNMRPQR
jgi:hypothetical protein